MAFRRQRLLPRVAGTSTTHAKLDEILSWVRNNPTEFQKQCEADAHRILGLLLPMLCLDSELYKVRLSQVIKILNGEEGS